MLRNTYLLMAITVCLGLAGCGENPETAHFVKFDPDADMRIANQVKPVSTGKILGDAPGTDENSALGAGSSTSPAPSSDPLIAGNTADSSDPLAGSDPLVSAPSGGEASDNRQRPIKNWYWIRGNISGGSVGIKINGVFIRDFSVHVDFEISNYLNNGANEITFVPDSSTQDQPVTCHLDIVYSQQQPGSLPVLTYDTELNAIQAATSNSPPPPVQSSQSANPMFPGSSVPQPAPETNITPSDAPVTMDFDAQ